MRGGRVLMAAGFLAAGLLVVLAGGQAQDNKAQPPKSAEVTNARAQGTVSAPEFLTSDL